MNPDLLNLSAARHWFERNSGEFASWRRDLHAHPELAFDEIRTSDFVAEKLESWGFDVSRGMARTGIIATLGGGAGPALGLRADMDALPMAEGNLFAHRSTHPERMHACGHDGHTVMLLAAAQFLAASDYPVRNLPGKIHFIFQPAEENEGGARVMVEEGLFERFPVKCVFGMHNMPGLNVGHFMVRGGAVAAGFDVFDFTLKAQGGHSAFPAVGGDAITAAAALVSLLQTIIARHIAAEDSAVLSVTRINGGTAYNILPEEVKVGGSVRWFSADIRDEIRRRMHLHAQGVAQAFGVTVNLHYETRNPAVVNAEEPATLAALAACDVAGIERVATKFPPLMASEDFAFMLERSAGAYLLTGNGATDGGCLLHSPHYDFNDEAIIHGALFWVALCRRFFEQNR